MTQTNPFTPQSGLPPRIFSGRRTEIDGFARNLDKMRDEQLEHILVLGEWGIGKTSLLRQFKKTSQDRGFWSCFCGVNRVDPKESISARLGLIVEEILLGLPVSEERIESLRRKFNFKTKSASSVQLEFAGFLLEVWKEMRASLSCIFLDDVQNFLPRFEVIDILRATLSREDIIKQTRFVFILSSTLQGWDYFLNKHDPIGRFFRKKIMLGPFGNEETESFIKEALKGAGVEFSREVKEKIFSFTGGHPYELQLLSSHLFDAQIEGLASDVSWEVALRNTLRDLGREYFETLYSKASEREKDILLILAEKGKNLTLAELRTVMILERKAKSFPIANIKNFVYRLMDKGLIKKTEESSYAVLDPLFREYIIRYKK